MTFGFGFGFPRRVGAGGVSFSPASLFAAGEVGAWYDPSDLTTLFQDTAGTTPVTTPGQVVALMLDKSRVQSFGGPKRNLLLYTQSMHNFTAAGQWQSFGGAVIASTTTNAPDNTNTASKITFGSGATSEIFQSNTPPNGTVTLSCFFRSTTAKKFRFKLANSNGIANLYSSDFIPTASWQRFEWTATASSASNISIANEAAGGVGEIEVWGAQLETGSVATTYQRIDAGPLPAAWLGNHATQATTASRPTYGIVPATGRRNLLLWSEDFSNAIWGKFNTTVTLNTTDTTAPDGSNTACRINETAAAFTFHNIRQGIAGFSAGNATVFSFYAKAGTRQYGWFGLFSNTGAFGGGIVFRDVIIDLSTGLRTGTEAGTLSYTYASDNLGNGWFRYRIAVQTTSGAGSIEGSFGPAESATSYASYTGAADKNVFFWHPQYELGSTATAYQRVTTQWNVTEAGVQSLSYLGFDGVDDFMLTGTITPGSVDKAQVFAGVRKLTDATQGMIVEYSASVDTNNGTFFLMGARSGGGVPNYGFRSKGTIQQDADATGYVAPITNVLGALGDISGDRATLRVNATQVAQATGDQGTGNFLAYPLYIGRRAGTSIPFSGNIYSLITRFSATNLDAATITSTETWVNGKTGAY